MKHFVIFLTIFFGSSFAHSQAFHFNDFFVFLDKNTDQSPVHWYLEIHNDVGVDTMLRWKTTFDGVPPQWVITYNDQNNYYPLVEDGDSADFVLYSNLTFPQKLLIGNILNNVTGGARVYVDVWDPNDPSGVQTISYRFNITQGVAGIEENIEQEQWYTLVDNSLQFLDFLEGQTVEIYSMNGKLIQSEIIEGPVILNTSDPDQMLLLRVTKGDSVLSAKITIH